MNGNQQFDEPFERPERHNVNVKTPPTTIPPTLPQVEKPHGYYSNGWRKVGDFLLGFFGVIVAWYVIIIPGEIIASFTNFDLLETPILVLLAVFLLGMALLFLKIKRRFIVFGMLASILFRMISYLMIRGLIANSGGL